VYNVPPTGSTGMAISVQEVWERLREEALTEDERAWVREHEERIDEALMTTSRRVSRFWYEVEMREVPSYDAEVYLRGLYRSRGWHVMVTAFGATSKALILKPAWYDQYLTCQ